MNQNVLFGLVAVLILLGGGYFLYSINSQSLGTQATSTPGTAFNTGTLAQASAPTVVADTSAAATNSTVVVTGTITPNGAPTTYWYEFGVSASLGSKTTVQEVGSGFAAIFAPAYITKLEKNTKYYVRLIAKNSFGTASGSTYSFSTNDTASTQGLVPTANLSVVSGVSSDAATLHAQINPRSTTATYWFEYGTDSNFGSVTSFRSAGSGNAPVASSATVSGLQSDTKYYYRVNAQNIFGTINSSVQSFTTDKAVAAAAPVVTTQAVSLLGVTTAKLVGTVNPYGAQTTYWFEYSLDTQFVAPLLETTPKTSAGSGSATVSVEASVGGLHTGTTYYYRIVAENTEGTVRGANATFVTN